MLLVWQIMTPKNDKAPPPNAARLMQQAVRRQQREHWNEAARLYEQLLTEYPDFADAWHFYGLLAYQTGDVETALRRLSRAHDISDGNPAHVANYARILSEQGQHDKALRLIESIRRSRPRDPQLLVLHAMILEQLDRGGELAEPLQQLAEVSPGDSQLWLLVGRCREQLGDRAVAIEAYRHAVQYANQSAPPYLHLADLHRRNGDYAQAVAVLNRVLEFDPRCADAWTALATVSAESGDFDAARAYGQKAIDADPSAYDAWLLLASMTATPEARKALLNEIAQRNPSIPARAETFPLHFALGTLYEKTEQYEAAFRAYDQANRYRQSLLRYDPARQQRYIELIIEKVDRETIDKLAGYRSGETVPSKPTPIFIVGMPRSGTTLVESVLAAHTRVAAGGEMQHLHDHLRKSMGPARLMETGTWLAQLEHAHLQQLLSVWMRGLTEAAGENAWITDKMPGNFALLGLIHACFPQAPIIHVQRDPLDTCFSCFSLSFSEAMGYTYDLSHLGHYYRLYQHVMAHWRDMLPTDRVIEIQYEALVNDPQAQFQKIVERCGISWEPDSLDFYSQHRAVRTASLYQVRQPVYTTSVNRWKHFDSHLDPLRKALQGDWQPEEAD